MLVDGSTLQLSVFGLSAAYALQRLFLPYKQEPPQLSCICTFSSLNLAQDKLSSKGSMHSIHLYFLICSTSAVVKDP